MQYPNYISLRDGFVIGSCQFMFCFMLHSDKSTRTPFSDEPWPLRPASKSQNHPKSTFRTIELWSHRGKNRQEGHNLTATCCKICHPGLWKSFQEMIPAVAHHCTGPSGQFEWAEMNQHIAAYSSSVCTKGIQVSRSTFSPGDRRDFFAFSDVSLQKKDHNHNSIFFRLMTGKCVVFWGYIKYIISCSAG